MLAGIPQEARALVANAIPFPSRFGFGEEYANLCAHIVENQYALPSPSFPPPPLFSSPLFSSSDLPDLTLSFSFWQKEERFTHSKISTVFLEHYFPSSFGFGGEYATNPSPYPFSSPLLLSFSAHSWFMLKYRYLNGETIRLDGALRINYVEPKMN